MNLWTYLVVMAGGACGTLARFVVADLMTPLSRQLPVGTIAINITGSFLIGLFGTLTLSHGRYPVPESLRMFVMIGFCGGYTTFSSFSLQTMELLQAGETVAAALYILASVGLCLAGVFLGYWIATHIGLPAQTEP